MTDALALSIATSVGRWSLVALRVQLSVSAVASPALQVPPSYLKGIFSLSASPEPRTFSWARTVTPERSFIGAGVLRPKATQGARGTWR